jgi:hypothetical protein
MKDGHCVSALFEIGKTDANPEVSHHYCTEKWGIAHEEERERGRWPKTSFGVDEAFFATSRS